MGASFSQYDVEKFFLEFMEAEGIPPADSKVVADGSLHRYVVRGNNSGKRTGAYVLYANGWPYGWAMDWRQGGNKIEWKIDASYMSDTSEDERAAYVAEIEARRKMQAVETSRLRDKAAFFASEQWRCATEISAEDTRLYGYLVKKKLQKAIGARLLGSNLIIPLRDEHGEITSVQTISANGNGEKRFLSHGRIGGCFCALAEDEFSTAKYIFICEGWATGVSIYEATGCPVVIAFSLSNVEKVLMIMREKYPTKLVLAADNDMKSRGNPGGSKALGLCDDFDIPVAIPYFNPGDKGSDWNDYACLYDLEVTAEAIYSAVEKWEQETFLQRRSSLPAWVDVNEKGKPKGTIANLEILLQKLGITLRYNEIAKEAEMSIPGTGYCADGKSAAEISHVLSLCAKFGLADAHVPDFLSSIAMQRSYNPVRDWILSKVWDREDRLEYLYSTLRIEAGFCEDFKNLLLRRWLISCVAAVFCKDFHNRGVLVLQGEQGIGKTAWLNSLVPESSEFFTSSTSMDVREKDDVKRVLGYWIVELGELEGVLRLDMPRLKAFLTLRNDEMRLPYGRGMTKYHRRTVFCASVNQFQFLSDPTGNSRWWSIPCASIDYRHGIDIQQMWAQVYQLYLDGERWYLDKAEEEQLTSSNWIFEHSDDIEDIIRSRFDWDHFEEDLELGLCDYLTATEVLKMCHIDQPIKAQAMKAGEILRTLTKRPAKRRSANRRCYLIPRGLNSS